MPIYDVKCLVCGYEEEQFIKIDDPLEKCSKCGGNMEKLCTCKTFKLKYDNSKDICGWSDSDYETSQYHRQDIDWEAGPSGLPNKG